jgi:hypothetical protein
MIKKFVVDTKDNIDGHIFCLRERGSEFKEWLSDPKKILNLAPFFLVKHQVIMAIL